MSSGKRRLPAVPARGKHVARSTHEKSEGASSRSGRPVDRSPGRPVRWIYGFASFFVLLGAGLIIIGGHDAALSRPTLGVTAASGLLLLTALFLWAAAWQLDGLCRRKEWKSGARPPCHPVVLVAFLLAVLLVSTSPFLGSRRRARSVT